MARLLIYGTRATAGSVRTMVCNFSGAASPAINQLPIRVMTFD